MACPLPTRNLDRQLAGLVLFATALLALAAPAGAQNQNTATRYVAVRRTCDGDVQPAVITAINAGIVTAAARESSTVGPPRQNLPTVQFQFGASNPAVLGGLHVGQVVCADFRDEKVTVDKQVAVADTRFWVVDGVKVFAIVWPGVSRGVISAFTTPQSSQNRPALTAVVTAEAREGPTPRTFQFNIPTKMLRELRVGQTVWADFRDRKVSLVEPAGGAQVGTIDQVQVFAITSIR